VKAQQWWWQIQWQRRKYTPNSNCAPKNIIALAYDTGGVTTSTVTVPLVAALGLGLASTIEGRNPIIDGFGLIAFASLFPIMSVLAYAQITDFLNRRKK
jgi:hypothetical protein